MTATAQRKRGLRGKPEVVEAMMIEARLHHTSLGLRATRAREDYPDGGVGRPH